MIATSEGYQPRQDIRQAMPKEQETGLEGRDCVPFFSSDKYQIVFEFFYLVAIFLVAVAVMIFMQFFSSDVGMSHPNKVFIFSILGGFFGGWTYDTKWFYRVTARGKNNQYKFSWQPHKFYWRVLTPFLSAIVAFNTYLLVTSGVLPINFAHQKSGMLAFSFSFLLGYFSDLVLSRLAAWAEKIIPKASDAK
tara:strand:+ start:31566 stop:32141 length:576 start_codon:yes stop_codon:yes gene_type:complete